MTAGSVGVVIGASILVDTVWWTPVVWEDQDEPDWFRSHGLEIIK
jgi:hypothetical protein